MLPTENNTGGINFILYWIVVSMLFLFCFVWKLISSLSRNNTQVERFGNYSVLATLKKKKVKRKIFILGK